MVWRQLAGAGGVDPDGRPPLRPVDWLLIVAVLMLVAILASPLLR